ncbi:MAG: hypothetical protein ABJB16_14350 [Saprospiraceae bacterium]
MYGLYDIDIKQMMDLFHRTPEVEEVILFGSRARVDTVREVMWIAVCH